MPAAMSMAAEMATGAPKPASDSMRAPKQKAMRMASTRWSSEMERMSWPSDSNQPVMTESWYTQTALRRIHMMGIAP